MDHRGSSRWQAAPSRRGAAWRGQRIDWVAYLFLLPFFLPFAVFTLAAAGFGLVVGFTEWGLIGDPIWVGLANVRRALADPLVSKAWGNTLRFALLVVPATTAAAFAMALLVERRGRLSALARTCFYAPAFVSASAVGLVWGWLLDGQLGLVNRALGAAGLPPVPWLTDAAWVLPGIALASVWWDAGFGMIVFLAGLRTIPPELREAAQLDGAGRLRVLLDVVLPLLRPATSLVVVLLTIGALRVFSQIYVMTNGGPGSASTSVMLYVVQVGFREYQLGYAAALGTLLLVTTLLVVAAELRLLRSDA